MAAAAAGAATAEVDGATAADAAAAGAAGGGASGGAASGFMESAATTPSTTPAKGSKSRRDSTAQSPHDVYKIRLIAGTANASLAQECAEELGIDLEQVEIGKFADGEIKMQLKNNIRGADVFVMQPTCPPNVNDNLVELLLLIHTLQLSSAKRITAVIPYYGYARQDRKSKARVPISAAAVAHLIETMGPHRVVTLDLHCGQIQGFFRQIPVDNLFAENEFIEQFRRLGADPTEVAVVSPDAGGVPRARRVADKIGASSVVTILKRRVAANIVDSMQLVGDVHGKLCLLVDDIIDTAGTLCKAAALLDTHGATKVIGIATHGVFSGPAMERLNASKLSEVWVSNSIPQQANMAACSRLRVISAAPLLAEAIQRLHKEQSLSRLFKVAHSVKVRADADRLPEFEGEGL